MRGRTVSVVCIAALAGAAISCSDSNPSQPSGTGSVTAPILVQPPPGASIRNADQPVTLAVENAVVTQAATKTYAFEVATDSNFNTKVQTRSEIAEGGNGQTSVRLDQLAPATQYYWHSRATGAGTTGVWGPTYQFAIGPAVVINAPTPVSPVGNAFTNARPIFTVTNASVTGPAGALTYRFEISTSPSFSPLTVTGVVPQGTARTTFQPQVDLPAEVTMYWRVSVTDQANGVSSPVSAAASFVTALAIDLSRLVYLNSPNVSTWPQTGALTLVEQDGNAALGGPMCMQFTDPGWPDSPWPFGGPDPNFGVYANQWYIAKIGGTWYGGAGEWIYRGASSCKAGQGTTTIGPDSGFGPPFSSWVPRVGELVGYMVTSVARNGPVRRTVDQRTNVIVQPWRDTSLGSTITVNRR